MNSKKILVTGGAGFVGSHTSKALALAGFQPIVYDNLSTGHGSSVRWGPLVVGDVGDAALLEKTIRQHRIEGVLHFAASAYVGESMERPEKYFENNVSNTFVLLKTMRKLQVPYIVFSSSCATYGNPVQLPLDESHPQNPVNPYGESKLVVERALRWYDVTVGIRSVCLRYFNAAGSDPNGEIGEDHNPETHLIPLVIEAARSMRPFVAMFGTDYDTPDGTAIRDYIHVSDLAHAHVKALNYLVAGGSSMAVNLGTGSGRSVREVIAAVERVSGLSVPIREEPRRAGDPPILVAHTHKAQQLLDWQPQLTDFDSVVDSAFRWHCSRFSRAVGAGA